MNLENNVVDVDFKEVVQEKEAEVVSIENTEMLTSAIEKTKHDDSLITDLVQDIIKQVRAKIDNPDEEFTLKHGFLTLAKSINTLGAYTCASEEEFMGELAKCRQIIAKNVMPAIPNDDKFNYSMRRLLFLAGTLIEYLYWRENCGDYLDEKQIEQAIAENKAE